MSRIKIPQKKIFRYTLCVFILIIFLFFIIFELCSVKNTFNNAVEYNNSIEFLYMENSAVEVGNSENVYVSFYNEDYAINSSLTFHKEDCNEVTVEPSFVNGEVALFSIPFNDNREIGKYNFDRVSWDTPDAGYQTIDKSYKGYSFCVNASYSGLGEDELPAGVYNLDKDGDISQDDLLTNEQTKMLFSNAALNLDKPHNGITICLDPGHGGSEVGAKNDDWGLYEKNINLRIAQVCRDELQKYPGVRVIMTRDGDWDVGLQQRANIARDNGANLFVSFHNNSGGGTGSEVWVQYAGCTWHNEFNAIGSDIANRILDKLCTKMGLDYRGVKSRICTDGSIYPNGALGDYFSVLYWSRYYEIPGILIEHAFMDTQPDFLLNDANLVKMGIYDAQAIAEYYQLDVYGPSDILSGTYRIGSALNDNKVMQVQNKSKFDTASIVVADDDSTLSQRWKVESSDNEWVTIQNIYSGKFLDVYDSKVFDEAKLQQFEQNNSDNQKWKIIKVKDKFKIVSKLSSNYVIDIPNSSLDPENKLQIFTDNETNNQLFSFTIDIPASDPDIVDGYYRISSASNSDLTLDVIGSSTDDGALLQTFNKHTEWPNQIFKVEKVDEKYHKITNIVTDKVLEVYASTTKYGVQLEQWKDNETLNQKWSIRKDKSGKYCFYSACNGQVFDCRGGKATSQNAVDLFNYHGGINQQWNLELYSYDIQSEMDTFAAAHKNDVDDGLYSIKSWQNDNFVLDVYAGSIADGANVQLFSNYYTDNQKWRIKHLDESGYATIINEKSGKYLEVANSVKREGTNIDQQGGSISLNKKWIVYNNRDNSFTIQSALSPMFYVTIDGSPQDEAGVYAAYTKTSNAQKFDLEKLDVVVPPSNPSFQDGFYTLNSNTINNLVVDLADSNLEDKAEYLLWTSGNTSMNQQFQFIKHGEYHLIKNIVSDKYLAIETGALSNKVVQLSEAEFAGCQWSVQIVNGLYNFINVKNGSYLAVKSDSVNKGNEIYTYKTTLYKSVAWNLTQKEDPYKTLDKLAIGNKNTIENGLYTINSLAGSNLVIDVYAGSMMPEANVQLFNNYYTANQKWYIENDDQTGYVYIKNEKSGYYLDVSYSSKRYNSSVEQFRLTKNPNQKWIIKKEGNSYKIISGLLLNLNLSAAFVPAANETNIVVSYASSNQAQSFTFTKADPTPPQPTTGTPICNQARTNVEKMMRYFNSTGHTYPSHYATYDYGGNTLYDFCSIIIEESVYEGVDPAVVFCQAMKETGWLTFTGDVDIDQCNFCGLGATGGGEPGCSFNMYKSDSVRMGIRAQVQHLKRYAVGWLVRVGEPIDPRFYIPKPGCAPTVEQLGGLWAPNLSYGVEIVNMMKNCY